MKKLALISTFLTGMLLLMQAHAVTVNYNISGEWTGLENFDVGGTLYNVEFADGTVDSVFGDPSGLAFSTSSAAHAAATQLMLFRLNDMPLPSSPAEPGASLASGCGGFSCDFLIPYFFDATDLKGAIHDIYWDTYDPEGGYWHGSFSPDNISRTLNTTGYDRLWVVFTTPVPVPGAFWLLGSGLIGLIGIAKRKKA